MPTTARHARSVAENIYDCLHSVNVREIDLNQAVARFGVVASLPKEFKGPPEAAIGDFL